MATAYIDGRFGSGYAPSVVPSPLPVSGWVEIAYDSVLQSDDELIPPGLTMRLPIRDGRLCGVDGEPGPVEVQATDDPALLQEGVRAKVTVQLAGANPVTFHVDLPTGETVQLHTAATGGPADGRTVFVHGLTPAQLDQLEAGLTLVEQERASAQTAKTGAETARAGAETARTGAETARTAAQTAQALAESARTGAEVAEDGAVVARTAAEAAEDGAVVARTAAEAARDNANDRVVSAVAEIQGRMTDATIWPDPTHPGFYLFAPSDAGPITPDPDHPGLYLLGSAA